MEWNRLKAVLFLGLVCRISVGWAMDLEIEVTDLELETARACDAADLCLAAGVGDLTDPLATSGLRLFAKPNEIEIESDTPDVIGPEDWTITACGSGSRVRFHPIARGRALLNVRAADRALSIDLRVSGAAASDAARFHLGVSDASTAVALDREMLVASDEDTGLISLYSRDRSGAPTAVFDFTEALRLTDSDDGVWREVDVEASTRIGNRIFWLGSHSNNKKGKCRPNRSRLFATDLSTRDDAPALTFVASYNELRQALRGWPPAAELGLRQGSNCPGLPPKDEGGRGFNLEGLSIAPDGDTAFLAFRAPLVGPEKRALIVTIPEFAERFDEVTVRHAAEQKRATRRLVESFGHGLLDLGGRGIRALTRTDTGYLIVAGSPAKRGRPPRDFQAFSWSGDFGQKPAQLACDFRALESDGSFEGVVEVHGDPIESFDVVIDNGTKDWDGSGIESKKLPAGQQKFRSDTVRCRQTQSLGDAQGAR